MPNLGFRQIYHRLMPDVIRLPFYVMKRRLKLDFLRWYFKVSDKNVIQMHQRLTRFHNAYAGQRCFIMGNGPSLNKMDLDLFKDEIVWGSNRCYLLFDRIQWRPKFYAAVDTTVVPDNASEINALSSKMPDALFFYPFAFRYKGVLRSASNVYWYNEILNNEDNLPYSMFSTNPSEFVYSVKTVTVAMLQLAVYFGFNPIYLIGCDTDYKVPSTVQAEDKANYELMSTKDDDMNHFDPKYFGKGRKWHQPNPHKMIFHYEQTKEVCDAMGVQVYNATVGGKLEVFPRVDYKDLF